jgi:hypothetical protein
MSHIIKLRVYLFIPFKLLVPHIKLLLNRKILYSNFFAFGLRSFGQLICAKGLRIWYT